MHDDIDFRLFAGFGFASSTKIRIPKHAYYAIRNLKQYSSIQIRYHYTPSGWHCISFLVQCSYHYVHRPKINTKITLHITITHLVPSTV